MDRPNEKAASGQIAQFLTTEHFTLQSARGMVNNELLSRVSIYFMTLSSLLIATAFLAQSPAMSLLFSVFITVAFPVIILLGFFTVAKLISLGYQDAAYIKAINQIRHYYYKAEPGTNEFLYFPPFDDIESIRHYGGYTTTFRGNLLSASNAVILANSITATLLASAFIIQRFSQSILEVLPYMIALFIVLYFSHGIVGLILTRPEMQRQDRNPKFPNTSSTEGG